MVQSILRELVVDGKTYKYYALDQLDPAVYNTLPISVRYLYESVIRNIAHKLTSEDDGKQVLNWEKNQHNDIEVPFLPSRVLLQDLTGVPAVVDLAAMREAVIGLGGDPTLVNPLCPVDLVIDHSVQVDFYGQTDSLSKNQELEFKRNSERFNFLKWGQKAFKNLRIVPPGTGIVHQINLEYLGRVVMVDEESQILYPDSVVGTDSHTTMIGGLGVLGWGVGGIEAEAVMLGQPISLLIPNVIGFRLDGDLNPLATGTDLVLTITEILRKRGVVGKFVEFFGPGVASLRIADRATIANMCPEYGATASFFPVDAKTIEYLKQTGRDQHSINRVEAYLKAAKLYVDYTDTSSFPTFTEVLTLDLSTLEPCLAGPKRPQDRVNVTNVKDEFLAGLTAPVSFKSFGLAADQVSKSIPIEIEGKKTAIRHGSVVLAAITSCTNTSNPSVMLGAGIIAKRATELGLTVPSYVKTSLSPGSTVVTEYLTASKLLPYLEKLGFNVVGYGCMTCIGNSGPLADPNVVQAIEDNDIVAASVLSGNRNFEGRVHPNIRANYLASPMLVVIYALAGRVDIDFEKEPIGQANGKDIYFKDLWPTLSEVYEYVDQFVLPEFFRTRYAHCEEGNDQWKSLHAPDTQTYPWDKNSTYIKCAPFCENMDATVTSHPTTIDHLRPLLNLGDSVTTDHISPAGSISGKSPAARHLKSLGVTPRDFNTYGSRRGNDEIMTRGTFANVRLINKFLTRPGPQTIHVASNTVGDVYDIAQKHLETGAKGLVIFAGKDYGCGSSRDWAAKGPLLLNVKAVIAESFERIHRSNLVGMGLIPLQFKDGENADTLGLTASDELTITLPEPLVPRSLVQVKEEKTGKTFEVIARFDTATEIEYFIHGGILRYMVRKVVNPSNVKAAH